MQDAREGKLTYIPPYMWYSSHKIGVSWSRKVEVANTNRSYVIQSGCYISKISTYLQSITTGINPDGPGDFVFIVARDKTLLASSSGETETKECGTIKAITAGKGSPGVNRTYVALTRRFGDPELWPKTINPFLTGGDSTLGPMVISVTTLEGIGDSNMDWALVLSSPYWGVESLRGVEIVVILATGIIILLTFATSKLSLLTTAGRSGPDVKPISEPSVESPTSDDYLMKKFIQGHVQLHRKGTEKPSQSPHAGLRDLTKALTYIKISSKKIGLWTFLKVEGKEEWRQEVLRIQKSKYWNMFMLLVLCCHCALAFGEAPTRTYVTNADLNLVYQCKLLAGRAFCFLIEAIDAWAMVSYGGLYVEKMVKTGTGITHYRLEKSVNFSLLGIIAILCFMFIDYAVAVSTLYTTTGVQRRLLFFLPYSALLRPPLLILRIPKVTLAAKRFLMTAYNSLSTLALLLLIILIAAIANVILFKGEIDTAGKLQGRTFDNLISSIILTSLFILTQSNMRISLEVVKCPLGPTGYYSNGCPKAAAYLYFTFISVIGYIIFLAVLIMVYQLEYFKLQRLEAARARDRKKQAYIAAFLVLEDDYERVRGSTLKAFFQEMERLFDHCPIYVNIADSAAIGVEEFVDCMEQFEPYMEGKQSASNYRYYTTNVSLLFYSSGSALIPLF